VRSSRWSSPNHSPTHTTSSSLDVEVNASDGCRCVEVSVDDAGSLPPSVGHAADDEESGRGLELVDALTQGEWGWESTGRGKRV
jgi:hypothetical protein